MRPCWLFIPLGLVPSLMYAFEGNFVARFGTGGGWAVAAAFGRFDQSGW